MILDTALSKLIYIEDGELRVACDFGYRILSVKPGTNPEIYRSLLIRRVRAVLNSTLDLVGSEP